MSEKKRLLQILEKGTEIIGACSRVLLVDNISKIQYQEIKDLVKETLKLTEGLP